MNSCCWGGDEIDSSVVMFGSWTTLPVGGEERGGGVFYSCHDNQEGQLVVRAEERARVGRNGHAYILLAEDRWMDDSKADELLLRYSVRS